MKEAEKAIEIEKRRAELDSAKAEVHAARDAFDHLDRQCISKAQSVMRHSDYTLTIESPEVKAVFEPLTQARAIRQAAESRLFRARIAWNHRPTLNPNRNHDR